MGWNTACILMSDGTPAYLRTLPRHSVARAASLLAYIYPNSEFRSAGVSNLLDDFAPTDAGPTVGAYDHGWILIATEIAGCVLDGQKALLQRCLSVLPTGSLMVVELNSTVGFFGYALYESRILRRAYSGEKGQIVIDVGPVQPEEQGYFQESEVREGQRFFRRRVAGAAREYSAVEFGETLTFAVMTRFFGVSFNRFEAERLEVERFRRAGILWRLLGR
jgi:hypothetical protein